MSIYPNLLAQAEKLRRHNRQGSFQTKGRYYEAFKRFLRFVAEEYKLEKLQNLSGKHMHSYFVHLKAKGLAASTIKTEASAIRFWHDQIPNAKHKLPSNVDLSLERRRYGDKDRTWSDSSYSQMLLECFGAQRQDYEACIVIARHAGLRIHEVMRFDAATARKALKTGILTFRGKNGLWRSVPINEHVRIALRDSLAHTKPGQKLFVPEGEKTHTIINDLEAFIREHREKLRFPDADGRAPITFHGLRHTFVKEHYTRLRRAGDTDLAACRRLAPLLGHKRPEIVHTYLTKELIAQFENGGGGDVRAFCEPAPNLQNVVANGGIRWYNRGIPLRVAASERRLHMSGHAQGSNSPEKRVYSVDEIAEILDISRGSAYELIREGLFRTVRIGSAIRVSRQSFDDWLDNQNQESEA